MKSLERYKNTVSSELISKFSYKNPMEVPRILKIVLNMGVGEAVIDKKHLQSAVSDLQLITGQKPVVTKAKKSIAGFKIREGWPIGCKVTLRKQKMWDFIDRFITVAIPRVRDFRGLPVKSFDSRGNLTLGVKEQIIFPEVDYDKVDKLRGLNITFVTSVNVDKQAEALFRSLGFPFKN